MILLFFSLFIISGLIIVSCVYIINPVPKINDENIIGYYHPLFSDVYSICIDKYDQYYLHTHSCILCYNADWEYQYSYIYQVSRDSGAVLLITDNGLFVESSVGLPMATISFAGSLTETKNGTYLPERKKRNKTVTNQSGKSFTLHSGFMFAKVVDNDGHTVWHSSYFGGIVFNCCLFSFFIGFYLFICYKYLVNHEKKKNRRVAIRGRFHDEHDEQSGDRPLIVPDCSGCGKCED